MTKINPVGILNSKAHSMVLGLVTNSPNKEQYVTDFFKLANKYNIQGPALVSYYSALHDIENDGSIKRIYHNNAQNVRKYVTDMLAAQQTKTADSIGTKADESFKDEMNTFVEKLNEMYHKHLRLRISLADQGAVNTKNVLNKTPKRTKFLVRAALLIDKLVTKFEPQMKNLYEFCKPVE